MPTATTPCPSCAAEAVRVFRPGTPTDRPQITSPEDAVALVAPMVAGADREQALVVALDTRHRLLTVITATIGSACNTFMGPRELFRDALRVGASAVFLAHNHPSGDPSPSAADRSVTRRLVAAGAVLDIDVLDHVVIGDPDWVSLARLGVV